MKTLEFLIPSYKRPHTLIQAIQSVGNQILEFNLRERVRITVVDDCSPFLIIEEINNDLQPFSGFLTFKQNNINKGMSLNIRDMVANSYSDFCTILTDDDHLHPNTLDQIIRTIDSLDNEYCDYNVSSIFVPRFSYLEDHSLNCIVCNPFKANSIIKSSPLNSIKYLHNGFILTGLFFKPNHINFELWDRNIENSFFPVIYFADLILNYDCLFVNQNWFFHTVLNECHWDSWGKTEEIRHLRLYRDYMEAVTISAKRALSKTTSIYDNIYLSLQEISAYLLQIRSLPSKLRPKIRDVDKLTLSAFAYKLAVIVFNLSEPVFRLRYLLSKAKRGVISSLRTLFYKFMEVVRQDI